MGLEAAVRRSGRSEPVTTGTPIPEAAGAGGGRFTAGARLAAGASPAKGGPASKTAPGRSIVGEVNARGTKTGADAESFRLWDVDPLVSTTAPGLEAVVEPMMRVSGPVILAAPGGRWIIEFRKPSAVKSVQSQHQPNKTPRQHGLPRIMRKLTTAKFNEHPAASTGGRIRTGDHRSRCSLDPRSRASNRTSSTRNGEGWRRLQRARIARFKLSVLQEGGRKNVSPAQEERNIYSAVATKRNGVWGRGGLPGRASFVARSGLDPTTSRSLQSGQADRAGGLALEDAPTRALAVERSILGGGAGWLVLGAGLEGG